MTQLATQQQVQPLDVTGTDLDKRLASEYDISEINAIVKACSPVTLAERSQFERVAILGSGMARLRELMNNSPMQVALMSLQGSQLGFTTDKDSKGGKYEWPIVRDVMIEAAIKGLQPIGNEITIISSRMYAGRNGLKRLVREFPGLTDLVPSYGLPQVMQSGTGRGAIVECSATWKLNGRAGSIECKIPIKGDEYSSVDQYLGKAERKLHARIYNILTGSDTIGEDEPGDGEEVVARGGRLERIDASRQAEAAIPGTSPIPAPAPKKQPDQAPAGAAEGQTGSPPRSGRPGPRKEAPTPPPEPSPMEEVLPEAEKFVAALDPMGVRAFLETVPQDILQKAMEIAQTNLDDKAPAAEVRSCATNAKAMMILANGDATPEAAPEDAEKLIEIEVDSFIKREKPKAKGLEKACQKVSPGALEAAKAELKFQGSVTGRKDEELEPLLRLAKKIELSAKAV